MRGVRPGGRKEGRKHGLSSRGDSFALAERVRHPEHAFIGKVSQAGLKQGASAVLRSLRCGGPERLRLPPGWSRRPPRNLQPSPGPRARRVCAAAGRSLGRTSSRPAAFEVSASRPGGRWMTVGDRDREAPPGSHDRRREGGAGWCLVLNAE